MARKTAPLGPINETEQNAPQQPLTPPPPVPERRRPGRPSNAERAARTATTPAPAPEPAIKLTESDMLPITTLALVTLSKGIKGDKPTQDEIAMVNSPMTAVANKYQIVSRWAPELALLGALMIVAANMRARVVVVKDTVEQQPAA